MTTEAAGESTGESTAGAAGDDGGVEGGVEGGVTAEEAAILLARIDRLLGVVAGLDARMSALDGPEGHRVRRPG